ncbi:uncharacterized protein ISCGN_026655 [Ixodes scapularis]
MRHNTMFSMGWSDDRHHMPTSLDVLAKPLQKDNRSCSIYTLCRTIGQLKRRFHCLYAELRMQQRDAVTSLSPAVSCTTWPRHTLAACQGLSSPKRFPSSPWQRVVTKAMRLGTPSLASSSVEPGDSLPPAAAASLSPAETAVKPPGTNVSCTAQSLEPAAPPPVADSRAALPLPEGPGCGSITLELRQMHV